MNTIDKIKTLLINSPEARDSYKNIISMYRFHFSNDEVYVSDSFIEREVRLLKRRFPELRDSNWASRQKHSVKMRDRFRSVESPENLKKVYGNEDVSYMPKKETFKQYIFRAIHLSGNTFFGQSKISSKQKHI